MKVIFLVPCLFLGLILISPAYCDFIRELEYIENCLWSQRGNVRIVQRVSFNYSLANEQWNIRKPIYPQGFLFPQDEKSVASIVRCCYLGRLKLAIKAQGHSFEKYSYMDDFHWVLDLSDMSRVTVESYLDNVVVQAGASGDQISTALSRFRTKGLVLGMCATVGIAGFTLGGGYGLASRTYGLSQDSVEQMNVVLYNGTRIVVDEFSHEDLFWALRGAGNGNYGVVTKFVFRALTVPPYVILIQKTYAESEFPFVFMALQRFFHSRPDNAINAFMNITVGENIQLLIAIITKSEAKRWSLVQFINSSFVTLKRDEIQMVSFENVSGFEPTPRIYFKAKSYYLSRLLSWSEILALFSSFEHLTPGSVFRIDSQAGAIAKVSPRATAYIHRHRIFVIQVAVRTNTTLEGRIGEIGLRIFDGEVGPLFDRESYQNYIDRELRDWQRRYYGFNLPRLSMIKRKYDPENFFHYPQSIPLTSRI